MINIEVVPFPSSFLRFRHTGTDIYDVNKWDVHVWRQKTGLPNKKILRYSFRRHSQELQPTLREVDRHHDTNSDTSIVAAIIAFLLRMVLPGSSIFLIMEGYETLVVDTCIMKHETWCIGTRTKDDDTIEQLLVDATSNTTCTTTTSKIMSAYSLIPQCAPTGLAGYSE
jgi:hypothetical protein